VAFQILESYLKGEQLDFDKFPVKLVQLAMGFLHTDRLSNERTIFSYWNYSPFNALRNAPPLTDEDNVEEPVKQEYTIDNSITIRIPISSLFITFACVTVWIALTMSQLIPVRSYQACLNN
jgi:hypothetical protein